MLTEARKPALAESGREPFWAVRRQLVRRWRRIPDFQSLRARGMVIGERVTAESGTQLDAGFPWLIEIGDDVVFSLDVIVLAHDASSRFGTGTTRLAPVRIGSRVFFGARSVVLPGATIGDDCIVAAGAVVSGDIPAGSVAAGVPARRISDIHSFLERRLEEARESPHWTTKEATDPQAGADYFRRLREEVADGAASVGNTELPDEPRVGR